MTLDDLLAGLETSAQIEKTASEQVADKPAISAELAGILEKKADTELTQNAFNQGEELAKLLLEKLANEINTSNDKMVSDGSKAVTSNETSGDVESVLQNTVDKSVASGATTDDRVNHETEVNNVAPAGEAVKQAEQTITEENTMDKVAQENLSLAKQIMEKLAQDFGPEVTTPAAADNTAAAAVPNQIQAGNAAMTAFDDQKAVGVTPGGDGTVNALFETIVAKAKADGGQSDDLINGSAHVASESVEKAAAVSALCEAGMDFEDAINMVKAAADELAGDAWEDEKRACLDQLMDAGIDFDQAVALIKEAEEDLAKAAQ